MEGKPPRTTVIPQNALRPADYGFARDFWGGPMSQLVGQGLPQFGGKIDPGMSPTMQMAMQMAQGFGISPSPFTMGQAAGSLGSIMGGGLNNWQYQPGPQAQKTLHGFMNPMMPNFGGGPLNFFGGPGAPNPVDNGMGGNGGGFGAPPTSSSGPFPMPPGGLGGGSFPGGGGGGFTTNHQPGGGHNMMPSGPGPGSFGGMGGGPPMSSSGPFPMPGGLGGPTAFPMAGRGGTPTDGGAGAEQSMMPPGFGGFGGFGGAVGNGMGGIGMGPGFGGFGGFGGALGGWDGGNKAGKGEILDYGTGGGFTSAMFGGPQGPMHSGFPMPLPSGPGPGSYPGGGGLSHMDGGGLMMGPPTSATMPGQLPPSGAPAQPTIFGNPPIMGGGPAVNPPGGPGAPPAAPTPSPGPAPKPAPPDPGRRFGGYTYQQLLNDPSLAGRLGHSGLEGWRQYVTANNIQGQNLPGSAPPRRGGGGGGGTGGGGGGGSTAPPFAGKGGGGGGMADLLMALSRPKGR